MTRVMWMGVFLLFASVLVGDAGLQTGDRIKIEVWRHPELSGEFPIGEDSLLFLPLIGPVNVVGKTPEELRDILYEEFSQYLKTPSIIVYPMFRVTVLGEVRVPGTYSVSGTETIADLIAMAGGVSEKAMLSRAKVYRGGKKLSLNVLKVMEEGRSIEEIGLRSGDVVVVPRKWWPTWQEWNVLISAINLAITVYAVVGRN